MLKQRVTGFALVAISTLYFCSVSIVEVRATEMPPAPQTSSQGGVKITIAPRGFSSEAKTWDFAITLETHTQSLDDDLAKTATLLADGRPSRPRGWEGAPPGGHHRKGVLRFEAVTPLPQAVELQIRRTGEASPRVFRWQLDPRP